LSLPPIKEKGNAQKVFIALGREDGSHKKVMVYDDLMMTPIGFKRLKESDELDPEYVHYFFDHKMVPEPEPEITMYKKAWQKVQPYIPLLTGIILGKFIL
jgi:hypothetical protein